MFFTTLVYKQDLPMEARPEVLHSFFSRREAINSRADAGYALLPTAILKCEQPADSEWPATYGYCISTINWLCR